MESANENVFEHCGPVDPVTLDCTMDTLALGLLGKRSRRELEEMKVGIRYDYIPEATYNSAKEPAEGYAVEIKTYPASDPDNEARHQTHYYFLVVRDGEIIATQELDPNDVTVEARQPVAAPVVEEVKPMAKAIFAVPDTYVHPEHRTMQ